VPVDRLGGHPLRRMCGDALPGPLIRTGTRVSAPTPQAGA
jgi:hypothetical protein